MKLELEFRNLFGQDEWRPNKLNLMGGFGGDSGGDAGGTFGASSGGGNSGDFGGSPTGEGTFAGDSSGSNSGAGAFAAGFDAGMAAVFGGGDNFGGAGSNFAGTSDSGAFGSGFDGGFGSSGASQAATAAAAFAAGQGAGSDAFASGGGGVFGGDSNFGGAGSSFAGGSPTGFDTGLGFSVSFDAQGNPFAISNPSSPFDFGVNTPQGQQWAGQQFASMLAGTPFGPGSTQFAGNNPGPGNFANALGAGQNQGGRSGAPGFTGQGVGFVGNDSSPFGMFGGPGLSALSAFSPSDQGIGGRGIGADQGVESGSRGGPGDFGGLGLGGGPNALGGPIGDIMSGRGEPGLTDIGMPQNSMVPSINTVVNSNPSLNSSLFSAAPFSQVATGLVGGVEPGNGRGDLGQFSPSVNPSLANDFANTVNPGVLGGLFAQTGAPPSGIIGNGLNAFSPNVTATPNIGVANTNSFAPFGGMLSPGPGISPNSMVASGFSSLGGQPLANNGAPGFDESGMFGFGPSFSIANTSPGFAPNNAFSPGTVTGPLGNSQASQQGLSGSQLAGLTGIAPGNLSFGNPFSGQPNFGSPLSFAPVAQSSNPLAGFGLFGGSPNVGSTSGIDAASIAPILPFLLGMRG